MLDSILVSLELQLCFVFHQVLSIMLLGFVGFTQNPV